MSNPSFDAALAFVLAREGGYVNDPRDPGGETNFGICKRSYPAEDIKNLTKQRAGEIYKQDFWDALGLDQYPAGLTLAMFDTAVNLGKSRAQELFATATAKAIGTSTPTADMLAHLTPAVERALTLELLMLRIEYYNNLAQKRPAMRAYLAGWIARVVLAAKAS